MGHILYYINKTNGVLEAELSRCERLSQSQHPSKTKENIDTYSYLYEHSYLYILFDKYGHDFPFNFI